MANVGRDVEFSGAAMGEYGIHPLVKRAGKVLEGEVLSRAEAIALAEQVTGSDVMDLLSLANKVRKKFSRHGNAACSIINAKSGTCSQNCRFCAQSGFHHCHIQEYGLRSPEDVLADAREVYATGVRAYGYVTSGRGYTELNEEFKTVLRTFDLIHAEMPDLKICASLGIMSDEMCRLLAEHHVDRFNMNLQTSPKRYHELIATTHTIQEKIATIRRLQAHGIKICCGGILGLGETWEDRVDMALAIRDLKVDGAPLNLLLPIPGTPLERQPLITPLDAAKSFALFRLINPSIMLKFAAGRETTMKDFQGLLMLSGLDSLMTGGYLTTKGRSVADDMILNRQLEAF